MATVRTERMMNSAPDYYQTSAIFEAIQAAQAGEYDSLEEKDMDLQQQLYVATATWGLKYWEEGLGIPTVVTDPYDIRRSRVMAKSRGFGNFSAALIKSVCEAFTNGEVAVRIDVVAQEVQVTFIGVRGVPPNLDDLKERVENIVHAHLGTTYSFTYLHWAELDDAALTWAELDGMTLTWTEFEIWLPT